MAFTNIDTKRETSNHKSTCLIFYPRFEIGDKVCGMHFPNEVFLALGESDYKS
jgi:hypothetical protein